MFRHFVPSRWLHPLAPLKRLSPVDLPSANSMKCCSPPASLKANKMNFMEQANRREQYAILQVGTGDSPLTIPFYEKCGFVRSHIIPNFFTDNYDHPIYEDGVQLVDMVYLQRQL